MWALFYERWLSTHRKPALGTIVVGAACTTAVAAFVDYQLTPKRFTPGFEAHLNRPNMVAVFGAIGLGLVAGALFNERRPSRRLR
jgi:hypothetical protein